LKAQQPHTGVAVTTIKKKGMSATASKIMLGKKKMRQMRRVEKLKKTMYSERL